MDDSSSSNEFNSEPREPELPRPDDFVALLQDPADRRNNIDNTEPSKLKIAFKMAAKYWGTVANHHIRLQKKLRLRQDKPSPDTDNSSDADLLARDAVSTVRLPWFGATKKFKHNERALTTDESKDEPIDVLDTRQLLTMKNGKLRTETEATEKKMIQDDETGAIFETARQFLLMTG